MNRRVKLLKRCFVDTKIFLVSRLAESMQIQLPEQFTSQEEPFLVQILQQVLDPTQSSNLLSGSLFHEMERKKGYLECLLVDVCRTGSHVSILCTILSILSLSANWQ